MMGTFKIMMAVILIVLFKIGTNVEINQMISLDVFQFCYSLCNTFTAKESNIKTQ